MLAFFQQNPQHIFCITAKGAISYLQLFSHAQQLSSRLPDKNYAINLCQNRYLFAVSYLAVLLKQQINLLPANQASQTLNQLLKTYPQSYCLTDNPKTQGQYFLVEDNFSTEISALPPINPQKISSISFSSGTTGQPKSTEKSWGEFQQAAQLAVKQLDLNKSLTLISTVPPQHMYGLETSLFWPLHSQLVIDYRRPFYPEDIRLAIESSTQACLLVSTPKHLQSCVRANIQSPNLKAILSSTAPLSATLAQRIEEHFNVPLLEILGSTETQSYACRRQTKNALWQLYQGIKLYGNNKRFSIKGGHLKDFIPLDDYYSLKGNDYFSLLGRHSDVIKIAGKRASLEQLNQLITRINGVDEGLFFLTNNERLGLLVVSHLTKNQLLSQLKAMIDEVFLPRPIYFVKQLPRNELGKISHHALQQCIKQCQSQ